MFAQLLFWSLISAFVILAAEVIIPLQIMAFCKSVKIDRAFGVEFSKSLKIDSYMYVRIVLMFIFISLGLLFSGRQELIAVLFSCLLIGLYLPAVVIFKLIRK